jgi:hypothetical protein
MNEKISKLQEQIGLLVSNTASQSIQQAALPSPISTTLPERTNRRPRLERRELPRSARVHRTPRTARHPQYVGHTSFAFGFGVAKRSLQGMGIQAGADLADSHTTTPARSPSPTDQIYFARDPLCSIPRNEAIRLVETYEEECGTIYPFLDNKLILRTAGDFYNGASVGRESLFVPGCNDENMSSGGILDIAKLVIAVALVIEASGPTVLSTELLESVEAGFDDRFRGLSVDVLGIQALTLMVWL